MPTTPPASPQSTRVPLLAISVFWLTVLLYVPAFDGMLAVGLDGSPPQFALAAFSVTLALAAVTAGMIRCVGFLRFPLQISIMLLLTSLFAVIHGTGVFEMITRPGDGEASSPPVD
jgi:hypothetical protein